MKIILTGGGTAGHVWPLMVVGQAIKKDFPETKILYLGSFRGVEKPIAEQVFDYRPIFTGKWRRYFSLSNFLDPILVVIGFIQALINIVGFRPDVVLAKGGYVALPVVAAAWVLKVPLVVHESDAVIGWVNRLASRIAELVLVGFPVNYYGGIDRSKLWYSGTPVRPEFFNRSAKKAIKQEYWKGRRPTVLVAGGSQGARAINRLIISILNDLLGHSTVVHLTGPRDYPAILSARRRLPVSLQARYQVFDWVSAGYPALVKSADVVVSRAGASALAELAAAGRPAVIIPIEGSANNHQVMNAAHYARHGAIVNLDRQATPRSLKKTLEVLLTNPRQRRLLGRAIKRLAPPQDAAELIARRLIDLRS